MACYFAVFALSARQAPESSLPATADSLRVDAASPGIAELLSYISLEDMEICDSVPFEPAWEQRNHTIYDLPYSLTTSCPNWKNLWVNTGVLFGAGFVTLGVLELLPESATAWNKAEIHKQPFFDRWWSNVKKGPVWDHDNVVFNYILHPYGGAAYYMSARSQGCNMFQSFLYGLAVSTVFWEYGIEAFMEVPSIQDLFITPIGGLLVGETFYRIKRYIVENDYHLLGSPVLGKAAAILVDPVNEVVNLFRGNPDANYSSRHSMAKRAWISAHPWVGSAWGGLPGAKAGFSIECIF